MGCRRWVSTRCFHSRRGSIPANIKMVIPNTNPDGSISALGGAVLQITGNDIPPPLLPPCQPVQIMIPLDAATREP